MQPWQLADEGCKARLAAARNLEGAVSDAADALNQCSARARARQINSPGISPLSSVVLAYSGDFGSFGDPLNNILTPTGLARASQFLNSMSAPDRAGFEKMLADAKSPQEAAYLWKALGAGYNSLADPQSFDQVIHPHGDDPSWLSGHLDPHINNLTQEGKYDLDWGSPEVMDI